MTRLRTEQRLAIRIWSAGVVICLLAGCGGGDGSGSHRQPARSEPFADSCSLTAVPDAGGCREVAVREDNRISTPFTEAGTAVELEVILTIPQNPGPHPLLVFHHGSTGNGSDPSLFGETFTSKAVARYFAERGWMVAFPQRRGRGRSDGTYDEGFKPDRSSYSCSREIALAGAEHALADLDAILDWLRGRSDVDTGRILSGGVSRGGVLALVHAARNQDLYLGALNFVGGWLGEGCGDYRSVNEALFLEGALYPRSTLWLYGANDSFYSVSYTQSLFDQFEQAGGIGIYHLFVRGQGLNGHFVVNDVALWGNAVDEYLQGL